MSKSSDFDPPVESEWHRMISEAAYFLAEKRGCGPGGALSDWLEAELQVKEALAGPDLPVALESTHGTP